MLRGAQSGAEIGTAENKNRDRKQPDQTINHSITKSLATFALGVVISGSSWRASAQTLFFDDFQTDSSANWSIYGISGIRVTNDYSARFAFDYGTQTYRYNGVTNFVPSSPNTGGTTKGLKVTVNKNGNFSIAAVSLYPTGRNFSGDYALKFDLWMDYSGDVPFGDGGSTEFSSFGLNHYGTNVNWPNTPPGGDGVWFNVSGEGGSGRDYRAYVGDPSGGPNTELTGSGGFLDRDNDGTPEQKRSGQRDLFSVSTDVPRPARPKPRSHRQTMGASGITPAPRGNQLADQRLLDRETF